MSKWILTLIAATISAALLLGGCYSKRQNQSVKTDRYFHLGWQKDIVGPYTVSARLKTTAADSSKKEPTRVAVEGTVEIMRPSPESGLSVPSMPTLEVTGFCLMQPGEHGEKCFIGDSTNNSIKIGEELHDSSWTLSWQPVDVSTDSLPIAYSYTIRLEDPLTNNEVTVRHITHPMSVRKHMHGTGYWTSGMPEPEVSQFTSSKQVLNYSVPDSCHVTCRVYDVLGQLVDWLVDDIRPPGVHEVQWDVSTIPNGIYFYKLDACDKSETKKMLIIR